MAYAGDELEVSMSISHIANAFEDGAALKSGPVDVVMTPREMGQLYLPSGQVVACDPIHLYDLKPFVQSIPAGRYPVILSIAEARDTNAQRVAFAMLRVSNETPVRWELATKETKSARQPYDDEADGYGVDVGLGSLMDLEAAYLLGKRMEDDDMYHNIIFESVEENRPQWANIVLDPATGLNFAVFETGFGDGFYSSYWGYQDSDRITCLVTDFQLFGTAAEEAKDWAWK